MFSSSFSRTHQAVRVVVGSVIAFLLLACGDSPTATHEASVRAKFWFVRATPNVVTIAKDSSYRLSAVMTDLDGHPIADGGTITFRSNDQSVVTVDSTGLLTALKVNTSGVTVFVTGTVGNLTHVDTVYVGVAAQVSPVKSISIHPLAGDSTRMAINTTKTLPLVISDSMGNPVTGVFARVYSKENDLAMTVSNTLLSARSLCKRWIYATTVAFGVPLTDSVEIEVVDRAATAVTVQALGDSALSIKMDGTAHSQLYLQQYATASFKNNLTVPLDVTFDTPDQVMAADGVTPGGNIVHLAPGATVSRKFTTKGAFGWTATGGGLSATASFGIR